MTPNKIGTIPEFSKEEGIEEEKKAPVEETEEKENETPTELPAEEKQSEDTEGETEEVVEPQKPEVSTEVETLKEKSEREKQGLLREIERLRKEKAELRKKEFLKTEEPLVVKKDEDLKDVNPADIELIDKVIKAKGYVRKDEFQKISYDSVKNDELNKFLEKYPEFKPENDPNDINWKALNEEISLYKMPSDPKKIGDILERARKSITKSFTNDTAKKRQIEIASKGGGSAQRSSSKGKLSDWQKEQYRTGGWSEEEIAELEN